MKHIFYILICCLAMCSYSQAANAQLSDEERYNLKNSVYQEYMMMGGDGCYVYKTKKHYVLISLVESFSSMNVFAESGAAELKAKQYMVEFLKGAKHNSVKCYDTESSDIDRESRDSNKGEINTKKSFEETFSNKIVETAQTKLNGGVQSLARFTGKDNRNVYVYFLVLSKAKAKKKY